MSPAPAVPARRIDANTQRAARTFLRRLDGKYVVVDALLMEAMRAAIISPIATPISPSS